MRKRTYTLLLVVLALLLAACGGGAATTQAPPPETKATQALPPTAEPTAAPAEPVVLRIGWAGSPDTLNPGTAVLAEAYTLFELVYDSMFQLQLDGSYTPALAESYEVSPDGKTWTFHLRPGARFHDGEPVTAADVVYSYNTYKNHEDFPFLPVYTGYFDTIEAPDDQTVVINLTEAIPNMESQLIFLYVVPEHIWSKLDDANLAEFENTEMIGSGPFKIVEYKQNEFVHLAVADNPLYHPKIDEIVFQTFENQDALVQALRTGQVDMITEMPATAVPKP